MSMTINRSGSAIAEEETHEPRIDHHVPALRHREIGDDADRRLPIFLCVHGLRSETAAEAGRLLRVLLLRLGAVSADPG
jgi:hypothetical protein